MEQLLAQVEQYKNEIKKFKVSTREELEAFRIKFLGTKGLVKTIMGEMRNVAVEQKKAAGQVLNDFKIFAENAYAEMLQVNGDNTDSAASTLDVSLPGQPLPLGSRHPISIVHNKIVSIFQRLGFSIAEGPEIEDDWHNFTALNLPENHPARDMQDTFYVELNPEMVLRTQTSSVQVHIMENQKPPIRTISPGRVYRNEAISARAHCQFHQIEGLYIDEKVSFADLKQTLYFFVQEMFGDLSPALSKREGAYARGILYFTFLRTILSFF